MKRLCLFMLALAVQPAFAKPDWPSDLQPIQDIPNTYMTLDWSKYTAEELRANSRIPKDPCLMLERETVAKAICQSSKTQNTARGYAKTILLASSYAEANHKFAQWAVKSARYAVNEDVLKELVAEIFQ